MNDNSENIPSTKNRWLITGALTLILLVFYQLVSDLVEGIYTLDLLNTQLDAKAAGMLFFFSSVFIWIIPSRKAVLAVRIVLGLMMTARIVEPWMGPTGKIIVAGVGVGAFFIGFPLILRIYENRFGNQANLDDKTGNRIFSEIIVFALAGASLLVQSLRTWGTTLDISMAGWGQILGILVAVGGFTLIYLSTKELESKEPVEESRTFLSFGKITVIVALITWCYFALNAPAAFNRWSEADYTTLVAVTNLSTASVMILVVFKPELLWKMKKWLIITGFGLFLAFFMVGIISNQTGFIDNPEQPYIVVGPATFFQKLWVYMACLLIFFLYTAVFHVIYPSFPPRTPKKAKKGVWSWVLNGFLLVLLIFIFIFTNVWGYVGPVSLWFRGLFWFPFLILGIIVAIPLTIAVVRKKFSAKKGTTNELSKKEGGMRYNSREKIAVTVVLMLIISFNTIWAYTTVPHPRDPNLQNNGSTPVSSLRIMTYNVQQGVNITGDKNFEQQLALIREINPDIIGLQESDTVKINTGNTDLVRYFSSKLNYYVYYGPKTVMQTYGVAILSRYPLQNFYSIYTYGDEDEIGSLFAEVVVGETIFNVMVNHPAGSSEAKMAHTQMMLERVEGLSKVILMGDFNWREDTEYYTMMTANYLDSWRTKWPTGTDDRNLVMNSTIDHIFLSSTLTVDNARYIPSPQSQTDHPAYWIDISW